MDQLEPALVLLAVVLLLVACVRDPPSFLRQLRGQIEQLGLELDRRFDRNRVALRLKVYSAEIARRKAEQNKGSLKVTPAPAPAAPKSQDRIPPSDPNPAGVRRQLPPGYRLPGDSEPDPR